MAQEVRNAMIGDPARFGLKLSWGEAPDGTRALGWGELTLWIAGRPHWGSKEQPVAWTWVDLVRHLGRSWTYVRFEQNGPFGMSLETPETLHQHVPRVRGEDPESVDAAVHRFQNRHDLAVGLEGIRLPSVWLLREGDRMRVRADGDDHWFAAREVLNVLNKFVAEVRREADLTNPRTESAFAHWSKRTAKPTKVLVIRTALPEEQLREWTPENLRLEEFWGKATAETETPLMAAARLSQPLAKKARRAIVEAVALTKPRETPELDGLSEEARNVLAASESLPPWEQGYRLAIWLRRRLKIQAKVVDPKQLLAGWNVGVESLPPLQRELDAVACWGPVGPVVLVNPKGRHASNDAGYRATLCHEICHLLIDRDHQLPACEVLGGATPLHLEKRARAFAAELLLPRWIVARAIAQTGQLVDAIKSLRAYGASRSVLGWQIRHGPGWDLLSANERRRVRNWVR